MNKGRFESFSDSVFAFAITLLILAIALPATLLSEQKLREALLGLKIDFVAFALSFAVIGIMWQNHHVLFRFEKVDRKTGLVLTYCSTSYNLLLEHLIVWVTYVAAVLLALALPVA
jgi:uncharacterized membrane protein